MRVVFSVQCLQDSAQWLRSPYSPNLMNMDKLRRNLENSGDISQAEWVNNGEIIRSTLDCELHEIQEITIRKIYIVSRSEIAINLSFLLNDMGVLYKNFRLNSTLNIIEELRLNKNHPFHASYIELPSINKASQPPEPMDVSTPAPPSIHRRP